jgi:hypothetical protein
MISLRNLSPGARLVHVQRSRIPTRKHMVCRASTEGTKPGIDISIMRVDSFAPELLNARLAMLGYASGVTVHSSTGETFTQQFETHFALFALATAVVTAATLIPVAKGLDPIRFTSYTTEMWVGRIAMLGFAVTLMLDEINSLN